MILYFSGTGNSRYVANELSRLMGDEVVNMVDVHEPDVAQGAGRMIWVFPVYSWGVPPVVVRLMERMRLSAGVPCWLVCTCGDDVGLVPEQWRSLVLGAGGNPLGAFSVEMPNTYVTFPGFDVDSGTVAEHKLQLAPSRIGHVASMIESGFDGDDVVRGRFAWIKSRIVYPWFIRHAMSPVPFFSTDACVGCGRCVRQCPMHNVELTADRCPVWGKDCAFCLRCYHTCPHHAVGYGRFTKGKGQYLCPLQ